MVNGLTHYVGGKHVAGKSGRELDVFNPATGEVMSKVPLAGQEEVEQIVVKANIWGDEGFKYVGSFNNSEGYIPSILLRLSSDKQLFINLKVLIKNGDEISEKEYVTFVNIPKRYQTEPNINV